MYTSYTYVISQRISFVLWAYPWRTNILSIHTYNRSFISILSLNNKKACTHTHTHTRWIHTKRNLQKIRSKGSIFVLWWGIEMREENCGSKNILIEYWLTVNLLNCQQFGFTFYILCRNVIRTEMNMIKERGFYMRCIDVAKQSLFFFIGISFYFWLWK